MAYALLNLGEWAAQRNARRRAAALAVPLLALMAAGCFTDPINRKPSVTITGPDPQVVSRQQTAKFRADANDPDGDAITYQWAFQDHDCMPDDPPDASAWKASTPDPTSFMVTASQTNGPFCVWVMATDAHNATAIKYLSVDPVDQPPVVKINVVSPDPAMGTPTAYPLYSTIELSSDGTSDPEGDALDYRTPAWVLTQVPGGSTATIQPCTPAASSTSSGAPHQCFNANAPGDYVVTLTVFDSQGQSGMVTRTIHVNEDQLPCIGVTEPGFTLPAVVRDPSVTQKIVIDQIIDDGSPYPQTLNATFSWFLSVNGGDWQLYSNSNKSPQFILPAGSYGIGDNVRVRVEVSDGTPKVAAVLAGCDSSEDLCPPNSATACYQRATWSFDFR